MSARPICDAASPATWRQTAAAPNPEPPVLAGAGDLGDVAHYLRDPLALHPRQEGAECPAPSKLAAAGAEPQPLRVLAPLCLPRLREAAQ